MSDTPEHRRIRFGTFEVDVASGSVWKRGLAIQVHDKPFQLLATLIERPGELVSRRELQERLWPADTTVEFENGLNNAVSRLREMLGDSAASPRFIETVPRRGYRFIAPVEIAGSPVVGSASREPARRRRTALAAASALALTASLLAAGLWLGTRRAAVVAPSVDSVAVLPFVTAEDAGERDTYVAFGMTEALIAELSRVGRLRVISQTSSLAYAGVRKPLVAIARELGVGAIVEGSVVHEGSAVRITIQLIDARSDTHLWTGTYRAAGENILANQGALAQTVAGEIHRRLTGQSAAWHADPGRVDPRAREAYLKGRLFLQKRGEENMARARAYFEEAVAADPAYTQALAGLADYYTLTDAISSAEALPKARAYALDALRLDPELPAVHDALGYVYYYGDWDWPAAEREYLRALAIDPNDARAHHRYARLLGTTGRPGEARAHIDRALLLDPLSATVLDAAASLSFNLREYGRMVEFANRILELDPGDQRGFEHLSIAYLHDGRYSDALAAAEQGRRILPGEPLFFLLSGIVQHRMGRAGESARLLGVVDAMGQNGHVPDVFRAIGAAQVGRSGQALDVLEAALADRDPYLVLLNVNPWFDPIREQPRFQAILRAMGFPRVPRLTGEPERGRGAALPDGAGRS